MMIKVSITISKIIFFIIISSTAMANEKYNIAVLDFTANNISESVACIVQNRIEMKLFSTGNYNLLERSKFEVFAGDKGIDPHHCNDKICAVKIGRKLSLKYVILGSIDFTGNKYLFHVKIVDVDQSVIVFIDSTTHSSPENLIDSSGAFVDRIDLFLVYGSGSDQKADDISGSNFFLTKRNGFLVPIGNLGEIVQYGIHGSLQVGVDKLFLDTRVGFETGYFWFKGRCETRHATLIPIIMTFEYSLPLLKNYRFLPRIAGGIFYTSVIKENEKNSAFEPALETALTLGFNINRFQVYLGAAYHGVFETDGIISFFEISLGIDLFF